MSTTVGLKLDDETRQRLQRLGEVKDRSSHWLMKQAIADYVEREEVYEQEKREDKDRWEAYLDTGEAIPQAEMAGFLDGLTTRAKADQG